MGNPNFIPCYICGREFGSHSIAFHEPQCLNLWKAQNNVLPPKQRQETPKKYAPQVPVHNSKSILNKSIVPKFVKDRLLPQRPGTHTLKESKVLKIFDSEQILERPRTQTLKHPTPNIIHPVITSESVNKEKSTIHKVVIEQPKQQNNPKKPAKKSKLNSLNDFESSSQSSSTSSSCCGLEISGKNINKISGRIPIFSPSTSNINVVPTQCTSCDRYVAPEKFHSHRNSKEAIRPNYKPSDLAVATVATNVSIRKTPSVPVKVYGDPKSLNIGTCIKPKALKMDRAMKVIDSGSSRRPQLAICYICGRQFGSKSLPIHESQCIERWKRENAQLPPSQRRSCPEKPRADLTRRDYNEASWKTFQSQLVPCSKCGRTFLPDRLEVHQKSCNSKADAKHFSLVPTNEEIRDLDNKRIERKSPLATCYICGRQFGSRSIGLHEPQCLKKWHLENEQLPQSMRREEPQKPEVIVNDEPRCSRLEKASHEVRQQQQMFPGARACWLFYLQRNGEIDLDAMADAAWQSHLSQLVPCNFCGRTFFPDRLLIHQRGCTGETRKSKSCN